ncbi:MAG: radical SAM family heme chaperone HemW [Actinomycetota bacterium]
MTVATHTSQRRDRAGTWAAEPGFGVYVHIPFCLHRCHYCDFNTYDGQDEIHTAYVEALITDIETAAPGWDFPAATSVFFGGGTPTLLAPAALARILRAVRNRVDISPIAEVTIEVNPETVDEGAFADLLESGFTRVSVGVQSLAPHVLRGLGRRHSAEQALAALDAARRAGVDDLNADLIYGSPWEREEDWSISLAGIVDSGPDHVSCYALTVEERTPLATLVRTGRIADVDPDVQAARHVLAEETLGNAGYARYEISNWALPGCASRHNVLYWSAGDYLGFGAGAHGHIGGRRYWNVRLPRDFVSRATTSGGTEDGFEVLDPSDRAGEALMLGLRLVSGVEVDAFAARFGISCLEERATAIESLLAAGLLVRTDGYLRLAPHATLLANDVCSRLL